MNPSHPTGLHRQVRRVRADRQVRLGRQVSLLAAVLAGGALLAGGCLLHQASGPSRGDRGAFAQRPASSAEPEATEPGHARWWRILTGLSRRRSSIWQHGRPVELDRVFAAHSSVLQRDRRAMRAYSERGLRVDGAEVVFGQVETVERSPRSVTLLVVDRLVEVTATHAGTAGRALPRDLPTRHEVVVRHTAAGWRISAIRRAER